MTPDSSPQAQWSTWSAQLWPSVALRRCLTKPFGQYCALRLSRRGRGSARYSNSRHAQKTNRLQSELTWDGARGEGGKGEGGEGEGKGGEELCRDVSGRWEKTHHMHTDMSFSRIVISTTYIQSTFIPKALALIVGSWRRMGRDAPGHFSRTLRNSCCLLMMFLSFCF